MDNTYGTLYVWYYTWVDTIALGARAPAQKYGDEASLLASPHAASPRPPRNLHLPRRALLLPTADAPII
jgi:hypothetical protein